MMRGVWICCVLLLVAAGSSFASDLEELVAAENRFAAAATSEGMRDAFLGVLADDGILFRPLPINGREWFEAQPSPPGVLFWKPVHADVSSAGDLGYTTGPWRYDLEGRETPFGHYMSIWRRAKDDTWKLVLDLGISHGEPEASAWEPAFAAAETAERGKGLKKGRLLRLEAALSEADNEFMRTAVESGLAEAFTRHADESIRFYREGRFPVVGLPAVMEFVEGSPKVHEAELVAAHVARSGDFGYTYGSGRAGQDGESAVDFGFTRIWRRDDDGEWKIVLEVVPLAP